MTSDSSPECLTVSPTLRYRSQVEPQANEYNKLEAFNLDLFRQLGSNGLGLLGLTVPEDYGGSGLDATAVALVHEELSYSDPAFALSFLAHSLLLVHNLSVNSQSETQKLKYLPTLCDGTWIGGMGMSEPNAGTDVLALQTKAEQDAQGNWTLNGTKMWITVRPPICALGCGRRMTLGLSAD